MSEKLFNDSTDWQNYYFYGLGGGEEEIRGNITEEESWEEVGKSEEILLKIFNYIPTRSLIQTIPLVNKQWERISKDDTLWLPRLDQIVHFHQNHKNLSSLKRLLQDEQKTVKEKYRKVSEEVKKQEKEEEEKRKKDMSTAKITLRINEMEYEEYIKEKAAAISTSIFCGKTITGNEREVMKMKSGEWAELISELEANEGLFYYPPSFLFFRSYFSSSPPPPPPSSSSRKNLFPSLLRFLSKPKSKSPHNNNNNNNNNNCNNCNNCNNICINNNNIINNEGGNEMERRIERVNINEIWKKEVKLCFLGEGGVGSKSAFIIRFITNEFVYEYDPTIEENYTKQIQFNGREMRLDMLDTSGQEDFALSIDQWVNSCDLFLIGFDVTREESINQIHKFIDRVVRVNKPFIIIGNKIDRIEARKVTSISGIDLAYQYNCPYIETSVFFNFNVHRAIFLALDYYFFFHSLPSSPSF